MSLRPQPLGRELRDSTGGYLEHRRAAAALAMVSMTSLAAIALYQLGVFKRLPEPELAGLDAEKVNGSAEAYQLLACPDAVLGLGSYAATLGLVTIGGADRARTQPWVPLALATKAGLDTMQAARLTRKSWVNYQAFSLYSLIVATATFLTLPLVVPEARVAWQNSGVAELITA